jgi:hypothetical protein
MFKITDSTVVKMRKAYNDERMSIRWVADKFDVPIQFARKICLNTSVTYHDDTYVPRKRTNIGEHKDLIIAKYNNGESIPKIINDLQISLNLLCSYSGVRSLLWRNGVRIPLEERLGRALKPKKRGPKPKQHVN